MRIIPKKETLTIEFKSDIDCLDEKELVSEIVGMTNTEGLAEKTGRGIDRIFEGSIVFGRPLPDYSETTSTYVKLFLQRAEPDLAFAKYIIQLN